MDRPKIIPADPVAAAEMAEQDANTETAPAKPRQPYPENPGLAEQNDGAGRVDVERPTPDADQAKQRGHTA